MPGRTNLPGCTVERISRLDALPARSAYLLDVHATARLLDVHPHDPARVVRLEVNDHVHAPSVEVLLRRGIQQESGPLRNDDKQLALVSHDFFRVTAELIFPNIPIQNRLVDREGLGSENRLQPPDETFRLVRRMSCALDDQGLQFERTIMPGAQRRGEVPDLRNVRHLDIAHSDEQADRKLRGRCRVLLLVRGDSAGDPQSWAGEDVPVEETWFGKERVEAEKTTQRVSHQRSVGLGRSIVRL